jgi:N-acetylneuraminate lyase
MNNTLHGILPALVTPLKEDGTLNEVALEKLLAHLYANGCHGVYLCGSTGEGLMLEASTRKRIVETVKRLSPADKQIIVHVGAWSVSESYELARHAERQGAAAISCLRPHGASFDELVALYAGLAKATKLPFLAYYFPAYTGGPLSVDQLERICALEGVAGLKFTDYDLFTLSLLSRQGKLIFHGRDEMLAAGLLMGACGGIGSIYNVAPRWFVDLWEHCQAGRWTEARAVQDRINDLIRVLVALPFMPALKRTLTWQGVPCGAALAPRQPLTADQETRLITALEGLPGLPRI